MKLRELYPSKYLKADDVEDMGGEVRALIKCLKIEELQDNEGKSEDKPVLYFLRVDKGLVLNKTNADLIATMHGDETDNWTGKEVLLVTESVTAFGQTRPAIRVRVPRKPAPTTAATAAALGAANPAPDPAESFS